MTEAKTVFLTGVTGFIAKRIAVELLNDGWAVRGSLRSRNRADEVRDAVRPHLTDPAALDRLQFVELDLTADAGWDAAMRGASALVHTASPFPMAPPKDEDVLIGTAVDGALRALKAAKMAGVTRVVLTSSMAAVMNKDIRPGETVTEDDWTDPDHPTATAYDRSKTLAERAAWDLVAEHPEMRLTAINPGLVVGTPLDRHYGTSLQVVERFFRGKDPLVPNFGVPVVALDDVARMHAEALRRPETEGNRYIAAAEWVMMPQLARWLKEAYPKRRIPTRVAPNWLLAILGLFDPSVRGIRPTLGRQLQVSNARARRDFGMDFIPARDAVLASAAFLARGE